MRFVASRQRSHQAAKAGRESECRAMAGAGLSRAADFGSVDFNVTLLPSKPPSRVRVSSWEVCGDMAALAPFRLTLLKVTKFDIVVPRYRVSQRPSRLGCG